MISGANRRSVFASTLAGCVWMALHGAAYADIHIETDVGAEYSDNIGRVSVDEQSDTIATARLGIGIEEIRPRLEARVDGDLQYRHYIDDTFDNELVGGLAADVVWAILPERFFWTIEDNYGQIAANRTLPDAPNNRQNFNVFSTGPDLRLPLGSRGFAEIMARWSDVYYEEPDEDSPTPLAGANQNSENIEGSVALGRRLSQQSTASINGSVEEIRYDDERLEDYRITEGFLRFDRQGNRTELSLDAGYTEAERGDHKSGGLLARLHLSREITARSTVGLDVGTEFSDPASAFRLDQVAGGVSPGTEDTLAAGDVLRLTYAYLRFGTERERTSLDFTLNARRERHEEEIALDRDSFGGGITFIRRLSLRTDFELRGAYTHEEFVESVDDFSFNEWSVGVGISWRISNRFSLRFTVDHAEGSSDGDGNGAVPQGVRDYEENRAFLGIRYTSRR
jgi:hypothetical protein